MRLLFLLIPRRLLRGPALKPRLIMKYWIWKNGKYIRSFMNKTLAEVQFDEVCEKSNPENDVVELMTASGRVLKTF